MSRKTVRLMIRRRTIRIRAMSRTMSRKITRGDMEKGVDNHGGGDSKDDSGDSSESAEGAEDPCGECLEPLLDGEEKYRTKNCHYECGVAVRAAWHALASKPKLLKRFKALKQKNPRAYARGIKNMRTEKTRKQNFENK